MAKAVLVMDEMPEDCTMCKFWNSKDDECYATGVEKFSLNSEEAKPDWCPLRELPEKKESDSFLIEAVKNDCFDGTDSDTAYFNGKDAGWNACLDEILKDDGMRKE